MSLRAKLFCLNVFFTRGARQRFHKKRINEVLEKLEDFSENLEKKVEYNTKQIELKKRQAIEFRRDNKKQLAIAQLKLLKMLEKSNEVLLKKYVNVQMYIETTTSAELTNQMISALEHSMIFQDRLNIDAVEKLVDEVNDFAEHHSDIANVLAEPLSSSDVVDDDELERELLSIENEVNAHQEMEIVEINFASKKMPEVPDRQTPSPSIEQPLLN